MVEVSEEQAAKLEKLEAEEARRKKYNKARSQAISVLVRDHKDEYDRLITQFS